MLFSQTFGRAHEDRPVFSAEPSQGCAERDRTGLGALRAEPFWIGGKLFTTLAASAAKLFTSGADGGEGFCAAFLRR